VKDYFAAESVPRTPRWLYIYLSVILKFLTVFIFLYTFTEKDLNKVRIFKENFKKGLVLFGSGGGGRESVVEISGADPLESLVNQMKSQGINVRLMTQFLTGPQIKTLQVREGQGGTVVVIPEAIVFSPGSLEIPPGSRPLLERLELLIYNLSYLVEINGYAGSGPAPLAADPLELSARRAMAVYNYFIARGIHPLKLKAGGFGDAFAVTGGGSPDKVELAFKSPEL
jgi:flagellar motor protein MotB